MEIINAEIERLVTLLKKDQSEDGSWAYPFDTGIMTDAYMIILLRTLKIDKEELIKQLVERLESKQGQNGSWKLFYDEKEGNLSLTIDAYYALLYSGYRNESDPNIAAARKFIVENGGLKRATMFTKIMLALTGQYPWPTIFPVPIEVMLIPQNPLIDIYDLSVFGRANLIPVILLGNQKFSRKTSQSPDLSKLYSYRTENEEYWEEYRSDEWKSIISTLKRLVKKMVGLPSQLHAMALKNAEKYMLDRIEPDGTFYNYFSSTYYMIFSLLSLGYPSKHPIIQKAVDGLIEMAVKIDGHTHIQYTTANVWNTALISHAMQEAGVGENHSSITKANEYLLLRQHKKYGDWIIHNHKAIPGGWGFSDLNTINPDVDDTTASLRSLYRFKNQYESEWIRGLNWVTSMRNSDGGWPAFERDVDNKLLNLIPIQGAEFILTDPSTPDLTGRTLEFLGNYTQIQPTNKLISKAVHWLHQEQKTDGSWYGRWGICYIYGTWAAITGLMAAGQHPESQEIIDGVEWLKSIQNHDGGWGESCYSDIEKRYIPLKESTLTHTAWALDALISVSENPTPEIKKAIAFLIREGKREDWTTSYPKGQGMANFFYIHYHSYRYIWPLLALSHYKNKYLS
ncbi:squalene--hopene cyclase [Cytobacillus sp. FJAT-54145]|uniref:Squalene--hopene cyclase n=1 Tax=Cytobacillus spartinae TaxID=3299023 RepID=A0ABW6KB52_9BACI